MIQCSSRLSVRLLQVHGCTVHYISAIALCDLAICLAVSELPLLPMMYIQEPASKLPDSFITSPLMRKGCRDLCLRFVGELGLELYGDLATFELLRVDAPEASAANMALRCAA